MLGQRIEGHATEAKTPVARNECRPEIHIAARHALASQPQLGRLFQIEANPSGGDAATRNLMPDDGTEPYRVKSARERFEVVDASGRVIMVCRDQGSATEYAVLLNEAYRRGYKAGCRQARARQAAVPPVPGPTSHFHKGA